jgi:hypothetical protein
VDSETEELDNEEPQVEPSGTAFSFAPNSPNSISGALLDEHESETSIDENEDEAYVPPLAKRRKVRATEVNIEKSLQT